MKMAMVERESEEMSALPLLYSTSSTLRVKTLRKTKVMEPDPPPDSSAADAMRGGTWGFSKGPNTEPEVG